MMSCEARKQVDASKYVRSHLNPADTQFERAPELVDEELRLLGHRFKGGRRLQN